MKGSGLKNKTISMLELISNFKTCDMFIKEQSLPLFEMLEENINFEDFEDYDNNYELYDFYQSLFRNCFLLISDIKEEVEKEESDSGEGWADNFQNEFIDFLIKELKSINKKNVGAYDFDKKEWNKKAGLS